MKSGVVCLLVLGLANVQNVFGIGPELKLDGVSTSELKEIQKEIAKGNVPPNYQTAEKPKRGVSKLTSSDNPSFNHLQQSTTAAKTAAVNPSPIRYLYNPYSYLPYVPQTHASQVAAQYSFQPSGATHYLQTPTQIQYVSSPSIQQVPSAKFQALTAKTPAPVSPYLYTAPQTFYQQPYVATSAAASAPASAAGTTSTSTATATSTPNQAYQTPTHPYYYHPQQPVIMLLVAPQHHPMSYLYPQQQQQAHQQQMAYYLQQQLLSQLYGAQRLGLSYQPQTSQVAYLVPMTVPSPVQTAQGQVQQSQQAQQAVTADKQSISSSPEVSASSTFGLRTKS